jgi:hypothetical protein
MQEQINQLKQENQHNGAANEILTKMVEKGQARIDDNGNVLLVNPETQSEHA